MTRFMPSLLFNPPLQESFVRFFFFNDTATTEIYTLSLHDALPISAPAAVGTAPIVVPVHGGGLGRGDRKSTRLNSSHVEISYAVFCLTKKKQASLPIGLRDELSTTSKSMKLASST